MLNTQENPREIIESGIDQYLTTFRSRLYDHYNSIRKAMELLNELDKADGGNRTEQITSGRGLYLGGDQYDENNDIHKLQNFLTGIRTIKFTEKQLKMAWISNTKDIHAHITKEVAKKKKLMMSKFLNDLNSDSNVIQMNIIRDGKHYDLLEGEVREDKWNGRYRFGADQIDNSEYTFLLYIQDTTGTYMLRTSNPWVSYLDKKPSLRTEYIKNTYLGMKDGLINQSLINY